MDTMKETTATERVAKLRKRVVRLDVQRAEIESRYNQERESVSRFEEARLQLIGELVYAEPAVEGWANTELDKLDSLLVAGGRKLKALENARTEIGLEIHPLLVGTAWLGPRLVRESYWYSMRI